MTSDSAAESGSVSEPLLGNATLATAADYAGIRICHRFHNYSCAGDPTVADAVFRPELVRACPDCGGLEWRATDE